MELTQLRTILERVKKSDLVARTREELSKLKEDERAALKRECEERYASFCEALRKERHIELAKSRLARGDFPYAPDHFPRFFEVVKIVATGKGGSPRDYLKGESLKKGPLNHPIPRLGEYNHDKIKSDARFRKGYKPAFGWTEEE